MSATGRALALWTAWAVAVVAIYYVRLWTAIPEWAGAFEGVALLSAIKHWGAFLACSAIAFAIAMPVGALLERPLGWPPLPRWWLALRRAVSGVTVLVVLLGPAADSVGHVAGLLAGWRLEHAAEAVSRALAGLFGAIVVLAAAVSAGGWIWRLRTWPAADWRDEVIYTVSLGLGAVAAVCGLLAALGLFQPTWIRIAILALVAFGLPQLGRTLRRAGHWTLRPPERRALNAVPLMAVSAAAAVFAFVSALAPEVEYDALWYHLGLPKLWMAEGRPVDLVHEYVSLYPLTLELTFAAATTFGGAVSAKLMHFLWLPLGALVVWRLAEHLVPDGEPWLAVALFVTAPTVLWEATTTYVDLALAVLIGQSVLALLVFVDRGQRGWLALAAVSLGFALAVKHLALVALAILAPGLLFVSWRRGSFSAAARATAALVALSLLVPLPWYARAWMASGNPFFPELYSIFGAMPPERWDVLAERALDGFKARFGPERPLHLLLLPWDVTMHAARYGGTLGPIFLLLLPALAIGRRGGARMLAWIGAFVAAFIAVWASPISSFQLRFLVVIVPLLAALGAEAARRVAEAAPATAARAFGWALVGLLALNLPPLTPIHERDRHEWDGWLTHVIRQAPLGVLLGRESEAEYLSARIPAYAAWQFINASTPADARVLTFVGGDHFYSDRWRISSNAPMAREGVWRPFGEEREAAAALSRLGITHVIADDVSLARESRDVALLGPEMRRRYLEPVYADGRCTVFRVRTEAFAADPDR